MFSQGKDQECLHEACKGHPVISSYAQTFLLLYFSPSPLLLPFVCNQTLPIPTFAKEKIFLAFQLNPLLK